MNNLNMDKGQFGTTGCRHGKSTHRNFHNYTCVNALIIVIIIGFKFILVQRRHFEIISALSIKQVNNYPYDLN